MTKIARLCLATLCFCLLSGFDLPEDIPSPIKRPEIPAQAPQIPATPAPKVARTIDHACLEELEKLQVRFEIMPDITGEGGCAVTAPLNITEIAPGISVVPETEMDCRSALAFARWVDQAVLPAAKAYAPADNLVRITQASTYVCRSRNNQEGAKISEHALGNAIDISAFTFASGKSVRIEPRDRTGSDEEAFQKSVRFAACQYFTTVIGPFSDVYHSDHLHLDVAERRGGYRLCRFPVLPNEEAPE